MNSNEVQSKLHAKLLESGEYDRLSTTLRDQLLSSGWYDKISKYANEKVQSQSNKNFESLIGDVESKGIELVPDEVKVEIMKMIKNFLESNI